MAQWAQTYRIYLYFCCLVAVLTASYILLFTPLGTRVKAESIQLFATIAAKESDFQLMLNGPTSTQVIPPNTIIEFELYYGSYLSSSTDLVVLEISWSRGEITDGSGNTVEILSYVDGSATSALGGATPVVNTANRTITWQINPMTPGINRSVRWQLRTTSTYTGSYPVNFRHNARLIGPGVVKNATPYENIYVYAPSVTPPPAPITPAPTPTPSPSPEVSVTPTPTEQPIPSITPSISPEPSVGPTVLPPTPHPTAPPNILAPIIGRIENIPIIGKPIKEGIDVVTEVAQQGGSLVAAPVTAVVALTPSISTIGLLLAHAPWWQIPSLLSALFWSKRRRPWGVVYDSVTKEPLDPVLITLTDDKGKSYTAISDIYGRYQFLVEPGTYSLDVKKTNYSFPATSLKNVPSDGVYQDIYYGGNITITNDSAINYNIPMDPVAADWNQQEKRSMGILGKLHIPDKVESGFFWGGFIWTTVMLLLAVTPLNIGIFAFYILLVGLRLFHRWRSPWGVIYDTRNKPIPAAAVHLVDVNNPLVKRPPVVTKNSGRYSFLVDGGKYQVRVAVKKPYGYGAPVPGPTITILGKQGTISQDLVIENAGIDSVNQPTSDSNQIGSSAGIILNPNKVKPTADNQKPTAE